MHTHVRLYLVEKNVCRNLYHLDDNLPELISQRFVGTSIKIAAK
jgi:hypothetical protein